MLAKRAAIQSKRPLSDERVLAILRESEVRIWRWHSSEHNPRSARLLAVYFRIFGAPNRSSALHPQWRERNKYGPCACSILANGIAGKARCETRMISAIGGVEYALCPNF